ncbi:MAG: two-component system LytT family response regulator [Saprospiraceae bacterium]|jgi:two-component system LytT family response regulator
MLQLTTESNQWKPPLKNKPKAKIISLNSQLHSVSVEDCTKTKLCIKLKEGIEIISIFDIIRLESDSNYTNICTLDGRKLLVSRTMKLIEEELPNSLFIRCHKSHVVNVENIKMIKKTSLILDTGKEIPISRQKYKEVLSKIELHFISI